MWTSSICYWRCWGLAYICALKLVSISDMILWYLTHYAQMPQTYPYMHSVLLVGRRQKCRPRPDAAERGPWSGSPLFAYILFYRDLNKKWKKNPPNNPYNGNGLIQLITVGNSIGINVLINTPSGVYNKVRRLMLVFIYIFTLCMRSTKVPLSLQSKWTHLHAQSEEVLSEGVQFWRFLYFF